MAAGLCLLGPRSTRAGFCAAGGAAARWAVSAEMIHPSAHARSRVGPRWQASDREQERGWPIPAAPPARAWRRRPRPPPARRARRIGGSAPRRSRSEEHTSELQSRPHLVCRLLLEKKKKQKYSLFLVNKKKIRYKK